MSQAGSSNQRDPRVPDSTRLQGAGDERLVSIIVPCRNERGHIDAFLDSATAQQLQAGWRMEILVADGESDDGTGERIQARAAVDARLVPVANPGRIVSTGLNACLARASGAVIVRMDVHTQFAPDYVAQCIAALQRTSADNVGGAWVARGEGAMGQAIAAAFQSRWVVGGALSRDVAYEGEADTVYLGCWPRQTFARVGGFDETLVRNQDDEHNLRLRLAGGCVWQSALIRSWYRPRDALGHLFRQQVQYGYWRPFVMKKHGQPGSVRQLVPAVFVAALVVTAMLAWAWPWPFVGLIAVYATYVLGVSGGAAWPSTADRGGGPASWGKIQRFVSLAPRVFLAVAAYHLGYGLGTWRGLFDLARGRRLSGALAKLTR